MQGTHFKPVKRPRPGGIVPVTPFPSKLKELFQGVGCGAMEPPSTVIHDKSHKVQPRGEAL